MMNFRSIRLPRGIRHSIWSVLDAALYPVIYLGTVPLMLKYMGIVNFGLWILLNSLVTILQLFNFNSGVANLAVATIRNVSLAKTTNDAGLARDAINSVLHITFVLFVAVAIIGIFLSYTSVHYGWWGFKGVTGERIALCVELAAIFAGLKFFDQVFQSIIKGYEHFRISSILNIVNRFGLLAVNLAMARCNYAIADMLFANIVFIFIYLSVQFLYIRSMQQDYSFGSVKNMALYKKLLGFNMLPWLQSIIIVFTFQSDRFWVSSFSGLKEVSSYGLASTMFNHVHMIFTAMVVWILPRVAGMKTRGEDPYALYELVRNCLFGCVVISLLFFYFIAPTVVRFWVGSELSGSIVSYLRSFVAFEIVFAHTILPTIYLNAAGKEKVATLATLGYCAVCYAFMMLGLFIFHSPLALVAGMTCSMCITMPFLNWIVYKSLSKPYPMKVALCQMLPMYTVVALIYIQSNSWIYACLAVTALYFLWRFYLSNLLTRRVWLHLP